MNTLLTTMKKEPSFLPTFDEIFGHNWGFNEPITTNNFLYEKTEGGGLLSINALGHNPEDIDIEVTETQLKVKAEVPEGSPPLVRNLDYKFKLNGKYPIDEINAEFKNGMVQIKFGNKEKVKPKKIQLKY